MYSDRSSLISIIVPVYNAEKYLDQCLDSLTKQSYKNIEIILINDGSLDLSPAICDRWAEIDSRVKVIHTRNYGVSHARNEGLKVIKGAYVGFVDADDWVETDTYECLLNELIKRKADVSGGGYVREEVGGPVNFFCLEASKAFARTDILKNIYSYDKHKILSWELCDKLFKREVIGDFRFNESVATGEDMLFFWTIMKHVNVFAYAPLSKYHYRMHEESVMNGGISSKTISGLFAVRRIWRSSQNESNELRQIILKQYLCAIIGISRQMLILDAQKYHKEIKRNQLIVRKSICAFLRMEKLSIRMVLGGVFLCLPLDICKRLLFFIKKSKD